MLAAVAEPNTAADLTDSPGGADFTLEGPEYPLVSDGIYDACFLYHETSTVFSKKVDRQRRGGKLYLWFTLVDPCNPTINRTRLFKAYNIINTVGRIGRHGRFRAGRRSNFALDYARLIGKLRRQDRPTLRAFKGKLFRVRVRTVLRNREQKDWHAANRYSVIDEICEIIVGG